MNKEITAVVSALAFLIVLPLIAVNLYIKEKDIEQKEKDRAAYLECLRANDQLLRDRPNNVSTHYCRM